MSEYILLDTNQANSISGRHGKYIYNSGCTVMSEYILLDTHQANSISGKHGKYMVVGISDFQYFFCHIAAKS